MGPSGGCLPFCTSGFPAFLDLRLLKSSRSENLVDMASTQIDETDRDCGGRLMVMRSRRAAPLKPKKSKVPWTEEEDAKLLRMWNEGRSWEYIAAALPGRSEGTIRVRCLTKFKKRSRIGADRS